MTHREYEKLNTITELSRELMHANKNRCKVLATGFWLLHVLALRLLQGESNPLSEEMVERINEEWGS